MSLLREFELLWKAESSREIEPDVIAFVRDSHTSDPVTILRVLQLDQRYRWQSNHPLMVEDYLSQLSSLPPDIDWQLQLALGELQARRDTVRPLDDAEISARFPNLSKTLRRHIQPTVGEAVPVVPFEAQVDPLCDEFEAAWQDANQRPDLDDYLRRMPSDVRTRLLEELLSIELCWRRRRGEQPVRKDYQSRFPQHTRLIQKLLRQMAEPHYDEKRAIERKTVHAPTVVAETVQCPNCGMIPPLSAGTSDEEITCADCGHVFFVENSSAAESATIISGEISTAHTHLNDGPFQNDAPEISTSLSSRYELQEVVGEGGMGVVYRGRHRALGMDVAIKLVKTECSPERFLREARLLAAISSPHIVRVHDFDLTDDGTQMLVMEWVDGSNLGDVSRAATTPVPESKVLPWMQQVAEGMAAAAAKGITHRDLKPSNILIDRAGKARVADFGLARQVTGTDDLSAESTILGTPHYMAPEQAETPALVDSRADIYSFGATFYHVLTGHTLFDGPGPFAILFQHKTADIVSARVSNPSLSNEISGILDRCLAKSPDDRYSTFEELCTSLAATGEDIVSDQRPVFSSRRDDPFYRSWGLFQPLSKPDRILVTADTVPQEWQALQQIHNYRPPAETHRIPPWLCANTHAIVEIRALAEEPVGINKVIDALSGVALIEYQAIASSAPNPNLHFCVIPMQAESPDRYLVEVGAQEYLEPENAFSPYRANTFVPEPFVGDGEWHIAKVEFDFRGLDTAAYSILAPRVNECCPRPGPGTLWIRDIQVYATPQ